MHSLELIKHPDLQPLMKKFKKKFPKIHLEAYMMDLLGCSTSDEVVPV
tara:strand:+ start:351 stop:494 length:144 start_codon:yes stop_codon:yes gene_type:complete